jgi:hypothetical protein
MGIISKVFHCYNAGNTKVKIPELFSVIVGYHVLKASPDFKLNVVSSWREDKMVEDGLVEP